MNNSRLAAACALARGVVRAEETPVLAALDPMLWRVAGTSEEPVLTLAGDLQLHAVELAGLPVARLSPTQAKALLAVLVVTATGEAHPYPGTAATVDDVVAVLGGTGMGLQALARTKGALNKLHAWRLAVLGLPDAEVVAADTGVQVRVGPAVALWCGPWVSELMRLVDQVAAHRRPR